MTRTRQISRITVAACTCLAVVLAACSDSGTKSATSTSSPATSSTAKGAAGNDAPAAEESTTVASVVSETIAPRSTTPTTAAAPTTTVVAAPVYPLTGLPLTDDTKGYRPALVVKIDNHPEARPQSGLNAADIVFEENVESLTRFAVVFQSQDSDPVGPIRSGRTQDVILLGALNHPLFAWSGGNGNVTRAIRESDLVDLSASVAGTQGGFFRSNDRKAPHNLYAKTSALYTFTAYLQAPPLPQFVYRAEGEAFNGQASSGVDLKMDGVNVTWKWDTASSSYLRFQGGRPHNDATLGQVNAANVVILELDYRPSPADARSPEAQTVGTGKVSVLTGGVLITGTWTRDDRLKPFTLTDETGSPITLTPGRTWVELARTGSLTPLA